MYSSQPQDTWTYRALLLEIIRRAAYDWVTYRTSRRLKHLALANEAFAWLFVEGPGHPDWEVRKKDGWDGFSFIAICDALDIDVDFARSKIKLITPQQISSTGRPRATRKLPPVTVEMVAMNSTDTSRLFTISEPDLEESFPPIW